MLVTGATDGIGLALVRQLLRAGTPVTAIGRRSLEDTPLREQPGREAPGPAGGASYQQIDLSDPAALAAGPAEGAHHFSRELSSAALLVHSAGLGLVGPPGTGELDESLRLLEVNLWAPIALSFAAPEAAQLYVSSVMASHPCRGFAVYGASKRGLEHFVRNLQAERRDGPAGALLRPGATRTGMHYKSGLLQAGERGRGMSPERVARAARRLAAALRSRRRAPRPRSVGMVNGLIHAIGPLREIAERRLQEMILRRRRPFTGWEGTRVLVTGGARGIGAALARRLLSAGAEVMLADLDRGEWGAEGDGTLPEGLTLRRLDLSELPALRDLVRELAADGGVDAVIHCAAISAVGHFRDLPLPAQRRVYEVNLRAPVALTEEVLRRDAGGAPALREGGAIVFLSSLAVRAGYPGAATYAATKAALTAYAEGIRRDCLDRGLQVSVVFPGPVRTDHARRYSPPGSSEARRRDPAAVAGDILRGVEARRFRVIPGLPTRAFFALGGVLPGLTRRLLRRALLDRLHAPRLPPNTNVGSTSQGSFSDQS